MKSFFIDLLIWVCFLLICGPVTLAIVLYQWVIHVIVLLCNSNMHSMAAFDRILAGGPSSEYFGDNVFITLRVEGLLPVPVFRDHFYKTFLTEGEENQGYLNLRCCIVTFGGVQFKKSFRTVDMENRIRNITLPPGISIDSFKAEWIKNNDYANDQPAWACVVIHQDNETVIVFKMHHGLLDGYSAVHIVERLTDVPAPYLVKGTLPTKIEKIKLTFKGIRSCASYSFDLFRNRFDKLQVAPNISPKKGNGSCWYVASTQLDLETIKKIRRVTNTHFVTVLMTIQVGALRRLLLETTNSLPKFIQLGNSLPVPEHPKMRNIICNHTAVGVFQILLDETNALNRLQCAEESFLKFLNDEIDKIQHVFSNEMISKMPTPILRGILSFDTVGNTPVSCISLPGSDKEETLCGQKVKYFSLDANLCTLNPCWHLFATHTTHLGQVNLSVNASSRLVPSEDAMNRLVQIYFQEELESLKTLCGT